MILISWKMDNYIENIYIWVGKIYFEMVQKYS